jgi:hypothetical protein
MGLRGKEKMETLENNESKERTTVKKVDEKESSMSLEMNNDNHRRGRETGRLWQETTST